MHPADEIPSPVPLVAGDGPSRELSVDLDEDARPPAFTRRPDPALELSIEKTLVPGC
jgi:hypothetical protein